MGTYTIPTVHCARHEHYEYDCIDCDDARVSPGVQAAAAVDPPPCAPPPADTTPPTFPQVVVRPDAIAFFLAQDLSCGPGGDAQRLAEAEVWAFYQGISYEWDVDEDAHDTDWRSDGLPWFCTLWAQDGTMLTSMGAIDFGLFQPWGDPYRRVVEAHLADEVRRAAAPRHKEVN